MTSDRRERVLLTGASGLVGGLALAHLGDRYEFHALSRRPVEGIPSTSASVTDLDAIRPAFRDVDKVLHLAASTDDDRDWDSQLGVTGIGTVNVLRAAQEAGIHRVVLMSTGSTMLGYEWDDGSPYGRLVRGEPEAAGDFPMLDAATPVRPDSPYGVAKVLVEAAGRFFADWYGMSIPVIRLGVVTAEDRPLMLRHFPGYLSHADAVQIMDLCLSAPDSLRFEIFDAISENSLRWRDTGPAKEILGFAPTGSSDRFDPDELRIPGELRDPLWPPERPA
jgi:NAD+ dependent glucose-6-phosphate dehydrogenase